MIRLRECWPMLVFLAAATGVLLVIYPPLALVPGLFYLFTVYFFRDPERKTPSGRGVVVSPADGRVLDVEAVEDAFVGKGRRLSIFMSPFDVHVNRSPAEGVVEAVEHRSGSKVAAYKRGSLESRERGRVEVSGAFKFAVEQYAGVFARRIVCFVRDGQHLAAGERFGMIRFGSRVDVVLPLSVDVKVSKGGRVVAGETIVGVLNG